MLVEFYGGSEWHSTGTTPGIGVTQVLKADEITVGTRFGFRDRVLRPIQIDSAEIRFLGREHDWALFGLVADLKLAARIHFRRKRVDRRKSEEIAGFHHTVPQERIEPGG